MRLLHRLRTDKARRNVEVLTVVLDRIRTPDRFERFDGLLADASSLAKRNVVDVALVLRPGETYAKRDPPIAQLVHRRHPTTEHDRVVERDIDHAHTETDPRGNRRGVSQSGEVLEDRVVLRVELA